MTLLGKLFSSFDSNKEKKDETNSTPSTLAYDNLLRPEDIYYHDESSPEPANVRCIELTEQEAVKLGWSFQKKSKHIRITNYHGYETEIVVPAMIGGMKVNELGDGCFAKGSVLSVEMPDTIVKIGNELFNKGAIKRVIFSDSIRVIPDELCYWSRVEEVHLPLLLNGIGKRAFGRCSHLKYIQLPDHLFKIGEEAFYASGLEGFSMNWQKSWQRYKWYFNPFRDGSIFQSTPMQRNHKIVALHTSEPNKLIVLTVAYNVNIKFPEGINLTMRENSVNGECTLDFSQCSSVDFGGMVYREGSYDYGIRGSYFCEAFISKEMNHLAFPNFVHVIYSDGTRRTDPIELTKDKSTGVLTVNITNNILMPSGLHTGAERIRLTCSNGKSCVIHQYAIDEKNLKSIDLGKFNGKGTIFSPQCSELHDVSGYFSGSWQLHYTEKHIPPSSLLGKGYGRILHQELMKAFSDKWGVFYDQTVIDDIFQQGFVKGRFVTVRVSQRAKILIAIDILRGKKIPYRQEERTMYSDYLKGHRRYATKVCNEITSKYPEYAKFLLKFYEN